MRNVPSLRAAAVAAGSLALVALGFALPVRAEDPPPNAPKPPDTPLPAFENPASDCQVGETCLYVVRDPADTEGRRLKYYEERVLARTATKALIETILTDAKGEKRYQVLGEVSGWTEVPKEFPAEQGPGQVWKKEMQADEIVYVGAEGALRAVRCTMRALEEPVIQGDKEGKKRIRKIWFSHDVAARGVAKMIPNRFPQGTEAERRAISWTKKLSPEECAKAAGKYPTAEEADKPVDPHAGMDEPGMDGPAGMDDPSMG